MQSSVLNVALCVCLDAGIAECCVADHEYECKSNQVTMTGTSACHVSRSSSASRENKTIFPKSLLTEEMLGVLLFSKICNNNANFY